MKHPAGTIPIVNIRLELQQPAMMQMAAAILRALQCGIRFADLKNSLLASEVGDERVQFACPDPILRDFRNAHPAILAGERKFVQRVGPSLAQHIADTIHPLSFWVNGLVLWPSGPSQRPHIYPATCPPSYDLYTLCVIKDIFDLVIDERIAASLLEQLLLARKDTPSGNSLIALAWNLWRMHNRLTLGILPPGVCLINELPFEILGLIFQYVSQSSKVQYARPRWNHASHVVLLLVCKSWKAVALDTHALWPRMVQGFGAVWTKRALERSGLLNLEVELGVPHFTLGGRDLQKSTRLILKHSDRFSSLKITAGSWLQMVIISASLQVLSVPQLKILEIVPSPKMFHGYDLRDDIFQGAPPPLLHTVVIAECTVNPTFPIFRSRLTSLSLIHCEAWLSLDPVLDTLRLLPHLVELKWDMTRAALLSLPSSVRLERAHFPLTNAHHALVSLQRMRTLALYCPLFCTAAIMQCVSLCISCEVHLLDDYFLTGVEERDLRDLERLFHDLGIAFGAHLSQIHSDAIDDLKHELHIDELAQSSNGRGAFTIATAVTRQIATPPVHSLEGSPSFASTTTCRCSITFSIPTTLDFLVDELDEDHPKFVHASVMRCIVQHVFAWPEIQSNLSLLKINHRYFTGPSMWLEALSPLRCVASVRIGDTVDNDMSSAVDGFTLALEKRPDCLRDLQELGLGSAVQLTAERSHNLGKALQKRYQEGGSRIRLDLLDCLYYP